MNEDMKQALTTWGVNWKDLGDRFAGNEALMERFLFKFIDDKSFPDLTDALAKDDAEEAFKACHTLKGVMANLSLDGFKEPVLDLTEILRGGSLDGAEELYDAIKAKYDALIDILKEYRK